MPHEILPSPFALQMKLGTFRPCHPEQGRNPREARIKRHKVAFGISDEKFDSAALAQRVRASLRMTRARACFLLSFILDSTAFLCYTKGRTRILLGGRDGS